MKKITDFNVKLLKIVNTFYSLGKRVSDEELIRKILRSLLDRFLIKVAFIEEYCGISTMTRNQVINKLQTYETNNLKKKKQKRIAFQAEMPSSENDDDDAETKIKNVKKSLATITKKIQTLTRGNLGNNKKKKFS